MQCTHVIRPTFGDCLLTPVSEVHRTGSSATTTPPHLGSSSWFGESSPEPTTILDPEQLFTPLTHEQYSHSTVNATVPPIPALFTSQSEVQFIIPGMSPLTLPDFATAPWGLHGWPLKYVCDMHQGFEWMHALEEGLLPMKIAEAFMPMFSVKYKVSTFNNQDHAWHAAGETPGECKKWIAHRHTQLGEWAKFMQVWCHSLKAK